VNRAPVAAVDATGLEARHVSLYYRIRREVPKRAPHRRRAWPKLTAVAHTSSHLILGAVTGTGPTQDSPDFTPALRQASALLRLDTVLGDAGYDAEHNHRLCREELGIGTTVIKLNPRNRGRRWPTTRYRRAMRQRFPHTLYHQRWHAESVFSRHKRRLGSALRARRTASQQREIVLRVLTHNRMILSRPLLRFSTEQARFHSRPRGHPTCLSDRRRRLKRPPRWLRSCPSCLRRPPRDTACTQLRWPANGPCRSWGEIPARSARDPQ